MRYDLPEAVNDHLSSNNTFDNSNCSDCGSIGCFADDSMYSKSGKDVDEIKDEIKDKFQLICDYMNKNKLVLNSDKPTS